VLALARRQGGPCPVHQSVESGAIGPLLDHDARPAAQLFHALVGDRAATVWTCHRKGAAAYRVAATSDHCRS
jgi:hypothetical protein